MNTGLTSLLIRALAMVALCLSGSLAATPITLDRSFAGNIDFVVTGGTLRTQSNAGNACAVTNGPVSAELSGIPAGATIRGAFLYWGGSGTTVDDIVTFDGASVSADKIFTENFNDAGFNLWYFGGVADITNVVAAKGNGSYSFADLAVTNTDQGAGATYCSSAAVVAGWGMVVVYEHPSQDFRVVNLFDGLRWFRGNSITLTPSNFQIPASPINGKLAVLTWEGDVENSAALNGFSENLIMNGSALTDGLNPLNNQFNNTINALGSNSAWGVDLDIYPIGSYLSAGDTSASTTYSSGGDLVLLTMEAISVTNVPISDLSILKRTNIPFQAGNAGQYRIEVRNQGPLVEPGPIVVTDTLDNQLSYAGFSGGGWACSAVGQNVSCSHPGPLAVNATLPNLLLDVTVQGGTAGQSIANTAVVDGANFDNITGNDSSTINSYVYGPATGIKWLYGYFDSAAAPFTTTLSRVVPALDSQTLNIAKNDGTTTLPLTPALARPLTIRAGLIPVRLCSRRSGTGFGGSNTSRTMNVTLDYVGAATGTIGSSASTSFTGTAWTSRTFNVNLGTELTLPEGTQLRLIVRNQSAGGGTRTVDVSSLQCGAGDVSRVELDAATVINVESVETYNAGWPAGAQITSAIDNGSTLFTRALVSDPFGSFDISSADFELLDKDDNVVSGPTSMNLVNDDVVNGQRLYQISFPVPPWQGSPYSFRVRADEGSEGTVFHFGVSAFAVSPQPPLLLLTKLASTASANPGSTVSYSIQVSNAGTGAASGVEIVDRLGRFLSLQLDTFGPGQSVEFVDGAPSSGLTAGAVEYSNDNGATWLYVPVDGGGGAPAGHDRNITHFRIPLSGDMPPGGSFTLNYDALVD